jgi:hypothetical protein
MDRLLTLLLAGYMVLVMTGLSLVVHEATTQPGAQNPATENPHAGSSDKPAREASDKSNRPEEQEEKEAYSAELKKCDAISNATQKQTCIDKVRKGHGQM